MYYFRSGHSTTTAAAMLVTNTIKFWTKSSAALLYLLICPWHLCLLSTSCCWLLMPWCVFRWSTVCVEGHRLAFLWRRLRKSLSFKRQKYIFIHKAILGRLPPHLCSLLTPSNRFYSLPSTRWQLSQWLQGFRCTWEISFFWFGSLVMKYPSEYPTTNWSLLLLQISKHSK